MNELFKRNRARSAIEKVTSLLNPRNVVVAGASDKPGNWPERIWRNLHRYKFPGAIYPMNPTRDVVWGETCYRSFADLPEPPDHVVVVVPPALVPKLLYEAAAAGATSATVFSSGFGEAPDDESQANAQALRAVIEETGLALSGPNCLGNFNSAAHFFTVPEDRLHDFTAGPVAIVAQSGGIVLAIKRALEERGIGVTALVTSGNEAGLTTGDYISYFVTLPDISVIVCYLESIRDTESFRVALRSAKAAGKPVVVLKLGSSEEGRAAAVAHTGSLAGSTEAFDAVAGALRVRSTDDMIEMIEFLVHARPSGCGVGAITYSGGMRGLVVDAVITNGLVFAPLGAKTKEAITSLPIPGIQVANPLDGGFAASGGLDAFLKCVEIYLADPAIDFLVMQEELPRAPGTTRQERVLREVNEMAGAAGKPVIFTSIVSHGLNEHARAERKKLPNLSFLQEPDRALRVISAATSYLERMSRPDEVAPPQRRDGRFLLERLHAGSSAATLDEMQSKKLLSIYGLESPREAFATTEEEAINEALRIGYPVALKIVSVDIPHKSDFGGVMLGIVDEPALRTAWRSMQKLGMAIPGSPKIDGAIVAEMVTRGHEFLLGMNRDREMGPVLVFGAGGVDVERIKDVALAGCPLDARAANSLIDRTRIGGLLGAWRGRAALDRDALVAALLGLSHLVCDGADLIHSIDINPFVLRATGGVALDALIVLNKGNDQDP